MKYFAVWLLLFGSAFAATHVNISIGQKAASNDVDENKTHEQAYNVAMDQVHADGSFHGRNDQERSAKLQNPPKNTQPTVEAKENEMQTTPNNNGQMHLMFNHHEHDGNTRRIPYNLRSRAHHSSQSNGQYMKVKEQEKENQEFERYIQSYHTSPFVETVFESPRPSQTSSDSSPQRIVLASHKPMPMHTFERQVALPNHQSKAAFMEEEHQVSYPTKPIHEPPPSHPSNQYPSKPINEVHPSHPMNNYPTKSISEIVPNHQLSPASGPANPPVTVIVPSSAPSLPADGTTKYDFKGQSPMDYDQPNFDTSISYNKPDYDPNSYNYDDHEQDFHSQIPPEHPEHGDHYGGYYGESEHQGNYLPPQSNGYLPPHHSYPRPIVTKTIQIAQPALKAKKYEIRHPAIQKEFYDIEERVLIKPAGTIVVELEHPVAKIPKGETILPLGHPHPAVAAAYNTNAHGFIQPQYTTGAYSNNNGISNSNKQYNPNPVYNTISNPAHVAVSGPVSSPAPAPTPTPERAYIASTTLASSVTTTPSYDQTKKDEYVEANLNKQFNPDVAQYASSTEHNYSAESQNNGELVAPVDNQAHQRSYHENEPDSKYLSQDENDFRYDPSSKRNDPYPSNNNQNNNRERNYNYNVPQNVQNTYRHSSNPYPSNYKSNNNPYKAEYFNEQNRANKDLMNGGRSARLQEEKPLAQNEGTPITHVIKHEHNIHLPPAQHNIFLSSRPAPKEYHHSDEEMAHVQEIKPTFLHNHKGPVVVYATTKVRNGPRYTPSYEAHYTEQRNQFPVSHHSKTEMFDGEPQTAQVQYSAPYSQMRYHPDDYQRGQYVNFHNGPKHANLVLEEKQDDNQVENQEDKLEEKPEIAETKEKEQSKMQTQAHIHIQIPSLSEEKDKPLVISSSIHPNLGQVSNKSSTNSSKESSKSDDSSEENDKTDSKKNESKERTRSRDEPDCDHSKQKEKHHGQFQRIVEKPSSAEQEHASLNNLKPDAVELNLKSSSGQMTPKSRVIAATPAPTDASANSESFHKRRIVVNHPFQTVREVVEHEPITNYHQVKVNEPATPALYQAAYYQQSHGALINSDQYSVPFSYHQTTHGNLKQHGDSRHTVTIPSYKHT